MPKDVTSHFPGIQSRFPVEILQEILKHNPPIFLNSQKGCSSYSPLLVSKYWHAAATSYQSLWSKISTESRMLFDPSFGRLLKVWYERSRESALDISIKLYQYTGAELDREETFPASSFNTHGENIAILVTTASRWISLRYESHVFEGVPAMLQAAHLARRLNSFSFTPPRNKMSWLPDFGFNDYVDSTLPFPEIARLKIKFNCQSLFITLCSRIGGSSVSELWIGFVDLAFACFEGIMQVMPNIKKLTLQGVLFHGCGKAGDDRTLLHQLDELVFLGLTGRIPELVLQCGPTLKVLSLPWQNNPALFDALGRAPVFLHSIILKWSRDFSLFPIDSSTLEPLLMGLPRLSSLDLILEGSDRLSVPSIKYSRVLAFVSAVKASNAARSSKSLNLPLLSLCIMQQPRDIDG
jgi:hypothetical protein